MINPWKVLGVHRKSTDEEIHTAYVNLAKQHHPDLGGDVTEFVVVNQAHRMLGSKSERINTIEVVFYFNTRCQPCKGTGVTAKSKSLTEKKYTACSNCGGAGFIIEEENKNVTIELHGTSGTGRKRSNKQR